jgi:hypothetical protein
VAAPAEHKEDARPRKSRQPPSPNSPVSSGKSGEIIDQGRKTADFVVENLEDSRACRLIPLPERTAEKFPLKTGIATEFDGGSVEIETGPS